MSGYQFLTRGDCWETPPGFLDWILQFNFTIPEDALYAGSGTVNGQKVMFWKWSDANGYATLSQEVGNGRLDCAAVNDKGGIVEFVIDVEIDFLIEFAISFFWTNSKK